MPISTNCPHCNTDFVVSDKFAGKTGFCPKCKHWITVGAISVPRVVIHEPKPPSQQPHRKSVSSDSGSQAASSPEDTPDANLGGLIFLGLIGLVFYAFIFKGPVSSPFAHILFCWVGVILGLIGALLCLSQLDGLDWEQHNWEIFTGGVAFAALGLYPIWFWGIPADAHALAAVHERRAAVSKTANDSNGNAVRLSNDIHPDAALHSPSATGAGAVERFKQTASVFMQRLKEGMRSTTFFSSAGDPLARARNIIRDGERDVARILDKVPRQQATQLYFRVSGYIEISDSYTIDVYASNSLIAPFTGIIQGKKMFIATNVLECEPAHMSSTILELMHQHREWEAFTIHCRFQNGQWQLAEGLEQTLRDLVRER